MMSRIVFFLLATVLACTLQPSSSFSSNGSKGFGSASSAGTKSGKKAKQQSPIAASTSDDAIAEYVARQLFGVCSHLQNGELYKPSWANVCEPTDDNKLVACQSIDRGDIVTFYPIHSLGLRGKKTSKGRRRTDYLVFDSDRDGAFFGSKRRTTKYCIDFPASTDRKELRGQSLFLDCNPDRDLVSGWMGHMCERGTVKEKSNCAAIPLEGAAPLCMIVATRDVAQGEILIRDVATNEGEAIIRDRITQSGNIALEKYSAEIAELATYTDMAYQSIVSQEEKDNKNDEQQSNTVNTEETATTYRDINLSYPGIEMFNRDPDIYAVENFLTEEECDRVVAKCKPHMAACVTKNPSTGVVGPDSRRTSTEAMLPRAEAPSIVSKLVELLNCEEDELEILQVLRYEKGQEFKAHTDGFEGPTTAAGFENSGRLVTVFTYLNDVRRGGHTDFPELGFSVAPKKGSAIIHFPASEQLQEDKRTLHQGMPAADEKWLLATWLWQHSRTDVQYAESKLRKLSEDII